MNVKLFKQTSLVVMMTTALGGCGLFSNLDEVVPDNTQKYRKAETMPPLDVPPELSRNRINDNVAGQADSSATYSEFEEAETNPLAAKYGITPDKKPALAGEGSSRHLVVPGAREVTWQRIQDFWASKRIGIDRIDDRIGLMDTLPDTDDYPYRVRMERGDTSQTADLYLTGADDAKRNAQKDEAMLRQLADYLGTLYQQDQASNTIQPTQELAVEESGRVLMMDDSSGHQYLLVEDTFQNVWLRVGRVLDSKGFSVEERNQAAGDYFIHYIDPFEEIQEDDGFFSGLAFWRDDEDEKPEEYFHIKLVSDAANTSVMVLDSEGERTSSDTAKRLLNLIQEQLVL